MITIADIVRPLSLTARLLGRFWPQLLLISALGYIARDLLLDAAVTVGLRYPLGGMTVLSLVVLVKLLVVVTMFAALRPGLPALASLRHDSTASGSISRQPYRAEHTLAVTAAVILPFFAYYAAWGFLGDTVREYSRLALDRVAFGERIQIFDLLQSRGLIAAILACWGIRWFAKHMNHRSPLPWWRLLIVVTDATWVFIGLYGLSVMKDEFIRWIGAGSLLASLHFEGFSLATVAHASEGFVPVELRQPDILEQAKNLFFYALLPMIWLVMAAIINGYNLSQPPAASMPLRTTSWHRWLSDFVSHFVGGYRTRYRPVWNCLRLTLTAGLGTLLTFIIAYRALNWIGAWLWYLATRMLGPYDLSTWQVIAGVLEVLIGSPSDLDGGILLDAMRIALLAAVLEHAVSTQRGTGNTVTT